MTRDGKHAAIFRSVASHGVSLSLSHPTDSHRCTFIMMTCGRNTPSTASLRPSTCRFRVSIGPRGLTDEMNKRIFFLFNRSHMTRHNLSLLTLLYSPLRIRFHNDDACLTHIYEHTQGWMVCFPLYLYARFLFVFLVLDTSFYHVVRPY